VANEFAALAMASADFLIDYISRGKSVPFIIKVTNCLSHLKALAAANSL
jgi:hypothetical protein